MLQTMHYGSYVTNPAPLKALIIPLTFLMVYPMMVNLQVQKVFSGQDYKLQLVTHLINIQVQAAAWYVKLTDRIFGPAEQALPQVS